MPNSKSTTDPPTTTTGLQQEKSDINKEKDRKTNRHIPEENEQMTDQKIWRFVGLFVGIGFPISVWSLLIICYRISMTVYIFQ